MGSKKKFRFIGTLNACANFLDALIQHLLFSSSSSHRVSTASALLEVNTPWKLYEKQTVLTVLSEVNANGNLSQNSISFELCTKIFCFQIYLFGGSFRG